MYKCKYRSIRDVFMIINTVIGIATLNQYAECVPYFIRTWNAYFPDITVRVVLVANAIPRSFEPYRDCIHLIPLSQLPPTISREDAARQLRYLYPPYYHSLSPRVQQGLTDTVLVSNITMIPRQAEPFIKAASLYDESIFLQMLDANPPENPDEPFPPRYTLATTESWLRMYNTSTSEPWEWPDVKRRFQTSFNSILLQSFMYPNNIRVVGSGRINYDPGVSDYTIRLPVAAYYVEMETMIQNQLNKNQ